MSRFLSENVHSEAFSDWYKKPANAWPLVTIPGEDAKAIGSKGTVATLSQQTAEKQKREHPELTQADYVEAQAVIDKATHKAKDTPASFVYIRDDQSLGGYVLVVKATRTGEGLFVTSYRKLSRQQAERDKEIGRLLRKAKND